jgi:putative phosphoesterase
MIVGVISDTHKLVRPEAIDALQGSELILHAGDVGDETVLDALAEIAPVVAVRGNNDKGAWAERLADVELVTAEAASIYILHDLHDLDIDPVAAGVRVVVSGHSHEPSIEEKRGVTYLNPGSAGPRCFKLPITVARLTVEGGAATAEIVRLLENG